MNRAIQWISIFGSVFLLPCLALGAEDTPRDRDPTAPSSQMRERIGASMRNTAPSVAPAENRPRELTPAVATPLPEIRIKAIVLSDDDNGSALLTANGRSVMLKLSRAKLRPAANGASRSTSGFTIGNVTFSIEDFSENSIHLRLSSDNSVMVVQ